MSTEALRNVAVVLAIAAVVAFVPGGGTTGNVVGQVLSIVFLAGLAFVASKLYREHRMTLYGLGDRNRGILYGSLGLAMLAVAGASKLWNTGPGSLVWFAMVGAAAYGLFHVVRASRQY